MRRPIVLALATVLALPALASAQDAPAAPSRFTVSPFLGYAFTYTQKGTVRFTDATGAYAGSYEREVQGGVMPGIAFEYHAPGRFGVSGAIAYNDRGPESLSTNFYDLTPIQTPGGHIWFARAALTLDLAEGDPGMRVYAPTGTLSVGPALLRDVPSAASGRPAASAFAVNAAASAELPLPWRGFAVRGSFEDYMAFLPTGDLAIQLASNVGTQTGRSTAAALSGGATHLYVIRGGLSFHF